MGWNSYDEEENTKKGMSLSSKILIGIIACVVLIIILLCILLINIKSSSFTTYVDGIEHSISKEKLLTTIDGVTYANIEEISKLVGYEYHKGEYKSSIIEEDKCYAEGKKETVSFYLNDNKIYKLPVNERDKQYEEYEVKDTIKSINKVMYASTEAISKAFNVLVDYKNGQFKIYTLNYLVTLYDSNVKQWGYSGIVDQSFENQKALLYGYLIVKKEGSLYKIIDSNNTKEFVLDRYTAIEFSESTQEFFVTDTFGKVGIVDSNGTIKIEPTYDNISLLDKESNLYIVKQNEKYGVVSGKGISIIYPQYDIIGIKNNITDNKYLLLNELIPVCKDNKWGAYNKQGRLILGLEYDDFGYNLTSIEIDGIKESVKPVLTIERCKGIVVKKADKYGLFDVNGRELVQIAVDGIYEIRGVESENLKYFMLYNGEELNVIEKLNKAGLIQNNNNNNQENEAENLIENSTTNNMIDNMLKNNIE